MKEEGDVMAGGRSHRQDSPRTTSPYLTFVLLELFGGRCCCTQRWCWSVSSGSLTMIRAY